MKLQLGHHVYGLAAIVFGVITLIWHQIFWLNHLSQPVILIYLAGIVVLIGGVAIQWQRSVKIGAIFIGVFFLIITLYLIPPIFQSPLDYGSWGNFFEEFSIVLGGVIVFAYDMQSNPERSAKITRIAYLCYGICVISYALYQLFYFSNTASLVPKWIPPGQMFWAVITTIAFAMAAVALLTGRSALLSSRLLTAMFIGFSLLIWLPLCLANPHEVTGWARNATNLAVAASAWVVADYLYRTETAKG